MPACLFRYQNQTVTTMQGRGNRYIVYLGQQPVTTATRLGKDAWKIGITYSRTLSEAAYKWLQRGQG